MSTFKRVFCLGLTSDGEVWVRVEVGHRNGPEDELSFTGVIGPKSNGDARGSCGQIDMSEWNFLSLYEELLAMPEATIRCPWRDFN